MRLTVIITLLAVGSSWGQTQIDWKSQIKSLPVYDVTNIAFGADPTGVKNSTTAIQAALNAANTNGGGTVLLPAGVYIISGHPVVYSNTIFTGVGANSIIRVGANQWPALGTAPAWAGFSAASSTIPNGIITALAADRVVFRDFTFDANGANQTNQTFGSDVVQDNATNSIIENVTVINAYHKGQMFGSQGGAGRNNQILNSRAMGPGTTNAGCVTNNGTGGFFVQNPLTLVEGNYATGLCDEAYVTNGVLAIDTIWRNNVAFDIFSQSTSAPTAFHCEDCSRVSWIGNTVQGYAASGFNAAPTGSGGHSETGIIVSGNTCGPDPSGNAPTTCISGLADSSGHTVSQVTISGNSSNGVSYGIICGGTQYTITNNVIQNSVTYGIELQAVCTYSTVINNVLNGNATDLFNGFSPAGSVVSPNILTSTTTSNITFGAQLQGSFLDSHTNIGAAAGNAYSIMSGATGNGIFRLDTNLDPDDNATQLNPSMSSWGFDMDAPSGYANLVYKAAGASGAAPNIMVWDPTYTIAYNPIEEPIGTGVASASSITPTAQFFHITGTTQINTIATTFSNSLGSQAILGTCLTIIPDGAWSTGTSGNIGLAVTSIAGQEIDFCWDGTKWWPGSSSGSGTYASIVEPVLNTVGTPPSGYGAPLLIWQNPTSVAAGYVAGEKIVIGSALTATPGLGNVIALQAFVSNDGSNAASIWGADIASFQDTPTYTGAVSVVVSGSTITVTTTAGNHKLTAGQNQDITFLTMSSGGSALIGPWAVAGVTSPAVFTIVNTSVPNGTYTGTMMVDTYQQTLEVETLSQCNSTNFQNQAFGGGGCRANGLEITGVGGTGYLTSALNVWSNNSSSSAWWYEGIVLSRIASVGLDFQQYSGDTGTYGLAAILDESNSINVLRVTGTHTSIFDFSGSPTFTNFVNGPTGGVTLAFANTAFLNIYTVANDSLDELSISAPSQEAIQVLPSIGAGDFNSITQNGDSAIVGTGATVGVGVLDLIVQSSSEIGIRIDAANDLMTLYGPLASPNLPTSAGSGGLYICVDTTGKEYKKSSCP